MQQIFLSINDTHRACSNDMYWREMGRPPTPAVLKRGPQRAIKPFPRVTQVQLVKVVNLGRGSHWQGSKNTRLTVRSTGQQYFCPSTTASWTTSCLTNEVGSIPQSSPLGSIFRKARGEGVCCQNELILSEQRLYSSKMADMFFYFFTFPVTVLHIKVKINVCCCA